MIFHEQLFRIKEYRSPFLKILITYNIELFYYEITVLEISTKNPILMTFDIELNFHEELNRWGLLTSRLKWWFDGLYQIFLSTLTELLLSSFKMQELRNIKTIFKFLYLPSVMLNTLKNDKSCPSAGSELRSIKYSLLGSRLSFFNSSILFSFKGSAFPMPIFSQYPSWIFSSYTNLRRNVIFCLLWYMKWKQTERFKIHQHRRKELFIMKIIAIQRQNPIRLLDTLQ